MAILETSTSFIVDTTDDMNNYFPRYNGKLKLTWGKK